MTNRTPSSRGQDHAAGARGSGGKASLRPYYRALPINLLRARELMMQRFRPHLQARGLTDQQWRIIRALTELGPAEILVLSEWCVILPASLSRILPKMEVSGLITRRTNAEDKRRVIIALSDSGKALFEAISPLSEDIYQTIAEDVGADRLQKFYMLLDEIVEALSDPRDGDKV